MVEMARLTLSTICGSGFSQFERHEDTIRAEHIVGERLALYGTMAPVERVRRLEIIPGSRCGEPCSTGCCGAGGL